MANAKALSYEEPGMPRGRRRGVRVALARSAGQITQGLKDQSEEYELDSKSFVQRGET